MKHQEKVKEFTDARNVAVVGFFNNKESELAKAFKAAADSIDDIEFGIASPGGEYTEDEKIVVFKKASFLLC